MVIRIVYGPFVEDVTQVTAKSWYDHHSFHGGKTLNTDKIVHCYTAPEIQRCLIYCDALERFIENLQDFSVIKLQ